MAKVKFYQGSSEKYDQIKYANGVYFATDTLTLYLNGQSYSDGRDVIIFNLHTLGATTISDLQLCNMFGVSEKYEIIEILTDLVNNSSARTIINKVGDWDEEFGYNDSSIATTALFAGYDSGDLFSTDSKSIYIIVSDPTDRTQLYLIEIAYSTSYDSDTEETTYNFSFNRLNLIEELSEEEIKLLWNAD